MKFDHIGIFVSDLKFGFDHISKIIGIKKFSKIHYDNNHRVKVQFLFDKDNICFEIVAPHGIDNPVDDLLKSKKNLLNHIAYRVDDMEESIQIFKENNCLQITDLLPAVAFKDAPVTFFFSPLGFIIELIGTAKK